MTDAATLSAAVETAFTGIARTRMAGLPVVNPVLDVAMRGLGRVGDHWVGVLVTPWFMNLMLIPVTPDDTPSRMGDKKAFALPSGRYEGIWGYEEGIGGFWSVSLFSPMFMFADRETAIATADAALVEILAAGEAPEPAEIDMAMIWNGTPIPPAPAAPHAAPAEKPAAMAEAADNVPPQPLSRRALFGLHRAEKAAP